MDVAISNSAISSCYEELVDLKEVWNAMTEPYAALEKVKETPWASVSARKIRKQLEDIMQGKETYLPAVLLLVSLLYLTAYFYHLQKCVHFQTKCASLMHFLVLMIQSNSSFLDMESSMISRQTH